MSRNESVFDILRAMGNRNTFQNDMMEIQSIISGYFRKKYFNRITDIINSEINSQKTNPSDDLRLLYALKPYTSGQGKGVLDNVIEMTAMIKAMDSIRETMPGPNAMVSAASIASVNPDGVYDIDAECRGRVVSEGHGGAYPDIILLLVVLAFLGNIF